MTVQNKNEPAVMIGLEVHVQVQTKTKLFTYQPCDESAEPNAYVDFFDIAIPGALPRLNSQVIDKAIAAGVALNCRICNSRFDRKHYTYADTPLGFQITQFYSPICRDGFLEIKGKRVRINRIHIETDAGKMVHENAQTLLDFNRCGIPLLEIVTEPDISSGEEAIDFLENLILCMRYAGISECCMERGNLRVDVNISIDGGSRVEVKNINSLAFVKKAIELEVKRQWLLQKEGRPLTRSETRSFSEDGTVFMRYKESSLDYRYMPEYNLPPVEVSFEHIKKIADSLPEMPSKRRSRYQTILSNEEIIKVLIAEKQIGDFFDAVITDGTDPLLAGNFIACDLVALLNRNEQSINQMVMPVSSLVQIIHMVNAEIISMKIAKELIKDCFSSMIEPKEIVEKRGLSKIRDKEVIRAILEKIIEEEKEAFLIYQKGDLRLEQMFIGKAMAATQGKVDPKIVVMLLREISGKESV